MKDHPLRPIVRWRQTDGVGGGRWERDKTTIWSGREDEDHRQLWGQTGSGVYIWQVKLDVINPAEWSYLCLFVSDDCVHLRASRPALPARPERGQQPTSDVLDSYNAMSVIQPLLK